MEYANYHQDEDQMTMHYLDSEFLCLEASIPHTK